MLSPSQRSQRGRLGALKLWATHDPKVVSAAGRAAFEAGFAEGTHDCRLCGPIEIPADLPEREKRRRREYARRAHFAALALASARSRAAKKKAPARPKADAQEVDRASDQTTAEAA